MNIIGALSTMEDAAINAGNLLLSMQPKTRRLDSRKDFLTDADLKSEDVILRALRKEYPDIPSFSEESGGKKLTKGYLWIVDPIDGTINFFLGDDHWGISIALAHNGRTIAAVIFLPAKKQLFYVSYNMTSRLRYIGGNMELNVNQESYLKESQFWVGWGKEEHKGADHKKVYGVIAKLDRHTLYPQIRNSATADMMMVACGKIAGYVFPKPEPFDIAAAGLIIERAGGVVTDMNGNPWNPFSKSIVASNGVIHNDLLNILNA